MNSTHLHDLKMNLRTRVQRVVNSTDVTVYYATLGQLWAFLNSNSLTRSLLADLKYRFAEIFEGKAKNAYDSPFYGNSEEEHAAYCCAVIHHCISANNPSEVIFAAAPYDRRGTEFDVKQQTFFRVFIEPLYEYLIEHLSDRSAMLALLLRYKHKCEWFQRDRLQGLLEQGERHLGMHLYEYLFDHGIEFSIEPTSASGEADLVGMQNSDDPLIADVKIFEPEDSKPKGYLIRGFHQVYTYTQDFNEPFGYLIVYNNSGTDLAFPAANTEQGIPIIQHSNKTIFIVVIDVFDHQKTASKRGRLESVQITEAELIRELTQQEA